MTLPLSESLRCFLLLGSIPNYRFEKYCITHIPRDETRHLQRSPNWKGHALRALPGLQSKRCGALFLLFVVHALKSELFYRSVSTKLWQNTHCAKNFAKHCVPYAVQYRVWMIVLVVNCCNDCVLGYHLRKRCRLLVRPPLNDLLYWRRSHSDQQGELRNFENTNIRWSRRAISWSDETQGGRRTHHCVKHDTFVWCATEWHGAWSPFQAHF